MSTVKAKTLTDDQSLSLKLYSEKECAKILSCSDKHIQNLRARGELPYVKFGSRIGVRAIALEEFLSRNTLGGWNQGTQDAA